MKSARINFGQPNTEYKLEINEAGEATSCYNQDTDTEYIGGGGGGDFSTAVVTMNVTEESGAGTTEISNAIVVDGPVLSTIFPSPTRNMSPVTIVLYKGSSVISISSHREVTAEGNIELDGGEDGGYWDYYATITGDCTINVTVGGLG